jgi:hypothetical protein
MRRLKARVRLMRQKVRRVFREPEVPSEIAKGFTEAQHRKVELMKRSTMFGVPDRPEEHDKKRG